jgi:hypothetical protein
MHIPHKTEILEFRVSLNTSISDRSATAHELQVRFKLGLISNIA